MLDSKIETVYGCALDVASFPGSPFWILSCTFGAPLVRDKIQNGEPKVRDKIRNGEPGNEATLDVLCVELAGNAQCGNSNNYGILFQGRQIALSFILNGIAQLLHTRSVPNCKPCTVVASSIVV